MDIVKTAQRYLRLAKLTASSRDALQKVAEEAFNKVIVARQKSPVANGSFLYCTGFDMESPTIMVVKYQYGSGDMELDASFKYDIIEGKPL